MGGSCCVARAKLSTFNPHVKSKGSTAYREEGGEPRGGRAPWCSSSPVLTPQSPAQGQRGRHWSAGEAVPSLRQIVLRQRHYQCKQSHGAAAIRGCMLPSTPSSLIPLFNFINNTWGQVFDMKSLVVYMNIYFCEFYGGFFLVYWCVWWTLENCTQKRWNLKGGFLFWSTFPLFSNNGTLIKRD